MKQLHVAALLLLVTLSFGAVNLRAEDPTVYDPIEPVNRGVFWFNDQADIYVLEPVARGYEKVTHSQVREVVTNFFSNLSYPGRVAADLVALEFEDAAKDLSRFVMNSTFGVAGLFDVATKFGLKDHKQDFGLAFAKLGAPAGPYLVLPILGPSNLRDTIGTIFDFATDPLYYLGRGADSSDPDYIASASLTVVKAINKRAQLLEAIKAAKESSVDYYFFVQGAYNQYRNGLLRKPGDNSDPFSDDAVGSGPDIFNSKGK